MAFFPFVYEAPQYGEREYRDAVSRYNVASQKYGDLLETAVDASQMGMEEAQGLRSYYRPGGGYGKGQVQRTKEAIEQGVAKTTAGQVASGMSSLVNTRGINVLAASEYAKNLADIEDQRAMLEMQAYQPYNQMISNLANLATAGVSLATAGPKRSQYVTQGPAQITGIRKLS